MYITVQFSHRILDKMTDIVLTTLKHFLKEILFCILIQISIKLVSWDLIDKYSPLVQIWHGAGTASHYLNQWWPISLIDACVTKHHCVYASAGTIILRANCAKCMYRYTMAADATAPRVALPSTAMGLTIHGTMVFQEKGFQLYLSISVLRKCKCISLNIFFRSIQQNKGQGAPYSITRPGSTLRDGGIPKWMSPSKSWYVRVRYNPVGFTWYRGMFI